MAKFPERLKELRKEMQLTQDDLAKKAKVSRSLIAMFEHGERDPGTEQLETLSDIFNVDMDYLMGRTSQRHKANIEMIGNNVNLETILYLNTLTEAQQAKLIAVAKAMFSSKEGD